MRKSLRLMGISQVAFIAAIAGANPALAQFQPSNTATISGTVTVTQTLAGASGTINAGGAISIASGNPIGLVMTGTSTLINNGTIQTLGTGRAIDSNAAGTNLSVTNTGLISSVSADAFRVNNSGSSVSLTNSGTIQVTNGGQALDWAGITTGANSLTNQSTGIITAVGEDVIRPGQNGFINNAGTITATPIVTAGDVSGSDGIDLRTEKNVTVTNTGNITGRHGIATDGANVGPSSLIVNNNAGTISAVNGSGINVDANVALPSALNVTANVTNAFGATIKGGVLAAALEADGDGIDVDGILTLVNSGKVLGLGAKGGTNNSEAIAAGGGTITNNATGEIVGSSLLADAPNGDAAKAGNGILIDDSNAGNALAATTIINSGLIQGKSGFGVKMIGTFADSITNNPGGAIRGAGTGAAIQTGGGADAVTNKGAITGDNGSAIDLGDGDDTLKIEGGAASVTGDINGGAGTNTLSFDMGTGNSFTSSDDISNFDSVEAKSGTLGINGTLSANTLSVLADATLKGTGTIDADVTLNGGTIAAGNSPGTMTVDGDLDLLDGTLDIEVDPLGISDFFFVNGNLAYGPDLKINLTFLTAPAPGSDWSILSFFDVFGTIDIDPLFNLKANLTIAGVDPELVDVTLRPVPEPATLALFGAGLAAFAAIGRRGRKGKSLQAAA